MKLIDKVKPEVLSALERENSIRYSASYKAIIASLSSVKRYRDLTIDHVDNLLVFLPNKFHPYGRVDFYYGDCLLKKEYQV